MYIGSDHETRKKWVLRKVNKPNSNTIGSLYKKDLKY